MQSICIFVSVFGYIINNLNQIVKKYFQKDLQKLFYYVILQLIKSKKEYVL